MVGIAYHLQQRQRYTVEVADFDFQEQEFLNEKTFIERVKESFSASFKSASTLRHYNSITHGGPSTLIDDANVNPILTGDDLPDLNSLQRNSSANASDSA